MAVKVLTGLAHLHGAVAAVPQEARNNSHHLSRWLASDAATTSGAGPILRSLEQEVCLLRLQCKSLYSAFRTAAACCLV